MSGGLDASISVSADRSIRRSPSAETLAQGRCHPRRDHAKPSNAAVLQDFRSIWTNFGRPCRATTARECLVAVRHQRPSPSGALVSWEIANEPFRTRRYPRHEHVPAGCRSTRRQSVRLWNRILLPVMGLENNGQPVMPKGFGSLQGLFLTIDATAAASRQQFHVDERHLVGRPEERRAEPRRQRDQRSCLRSAIPTSTGIAADGRHGRCLVCQKLSWWCRSGDGLRQQQGQCRVCLGRATDGAFRWHRYAGTAKQALISAIRMLAAAYARSGQMQDAQRWLSEADRLWPYDTVRGQFPPC
jgi:hypothetical protein